MSASALVLMTHSDVWSTQGRGYYGFAALQWSYGKVLVDSKK